MGIPVTEVGEAPDGAGGVVAVQHNPDDAHTVQLTGIMSREELISRVLPFEDLQPIDQEVVTTLLNTIEAPCEPCDGRTLASCIIDMPDGCENIPELLDRTVRMFNHSAPPEAVRSALTYTDHWVPLTPDVRPVEGPKDGVPLDVWVDPAGPSVRAVIQTLDALKLAGVAIRYHIAPLDNPTSDVHRAFAGGAIAAEAQGLLEPFIRRTLAWRDEQREADATAVPKLTLDDLPIIVLDVKGLDTKAFDSTRTSRTTVARIDGDLTLATQVGVRVAPSWFVDGYRLRGAQSATAIQQVINRELADRIDTHTTGLREE